MHRYHISYVGSYTNRVKKGIDKINPDFISFLVESSSELWSAFEQKCLDEILQDYGPDYKKKTETIEFPHQIPLDELQKLIFSKLFTMIRERKNKFKNDVEITIDVTAAPKTVTYVLTFLSMVLSTKQSRIKLLYTPKGLESNPCFYAPTGSDYLCKDKNLSLADYRLNEKIDPGKDTLEVELPIANFEIFKNRQRSPYLLSLFTHIPGSKSEPKNTTTILDEMANCDAELLKKCESEAEKQEKEKDNTSQKAVHHKLAAALGDFEDAGIIELKRNGRSYSVRKTWAGDLISSVTEILHRENKQNIVSSNVPKEISKTKKQSKTKKN